MARSNLTYIPFF